MSKKLIKSNVGQTKRLLQIKRGFDNYIGGPTSERGLWIKWLGTKFKGDAHLSTCKTTQYNYGLSKENEVLIVKVSNGNWGGG